MNACGLVNCRAAFLFVIVRCEGRRGCHASILGSMVAQRCPESSPVVREHPCDEEVFDALQEDDLSLTVKDAEFEWAPAVGVGGDAQHQWCEPAREAPASGLRSTDGMVELCCTHQIVPGESGLRSCCWYMHHHQHSRRVGYPCNSTGGDLDLRVDGLTGDHVCVCVLGLYLGKDALVFLWCASSMACNKFVPRILRQFQPETEQRPSWLPLSSRL